MTHAILRGRIELGRRAAECRIEEYGIVAEAAVALRLPRDLAGPRPARDQRSGILGMLERDEHAVKSRRAIDPRRVERRKKLRDVRAVVRALACESRRANAGSYSERGDDETRVVRDGREAGVPRGMPSLR